MATVIDTRQGPRPRHPEKRNRPDTPILRKPDWLRVRAPGSEGYAATRAIVKAHGLVTVCEEAACPNIGECWTQSHATMMIMGEVCTRACAFCNVATGRPEPLDATEPARVGDAVAKMGLKHVVITSVDRDDLASIRPGARYYHSLRLLERVKEADPEAFTKSGLMVGLGETREEVLQVMDDMRSAGVDFLTLGQYLQPTRKHAAVERFVHPDEFRGYEEAARAKGFLMVSASPLTRSSHHAGEDFARLKAARRARAG